MKKEQLNQRIGKRVAAIREQKGMSQSDLARACMKDRQGIDRLEKGGTNPTVYTLYEIATALGVSLEELVRI